MIEASRTVHGFLFFCNLPKRHVFNPALVWRPVTPVGISIYVTTFPFQELLRLAEVAELRVRLPLRRTSRNARTCAAQRDLAQRGHAQPSGVPLLRPSVVASQEELLRTKISG